MIRFRPSRKTRTPCAFLVFVVVVFVSGTARAERVEITAQVDTDVVEVGETVTYSQQVRVHGSLSPREPKPGSILGFSLRGVSSAPVQMRSIVNGAVDDIMGVTTSWTLHADKVGSFSLGPSEVTVGSERKAGNAVRIRVVPRGSGLARPKRAPLADPFGSSSLDPFKSLFDFGDDDRRAEAQPQAPSADPKLAMPSPRAPVAFLHATLDKTRAVVGEQVTLHVYLYEDPYARQGRPGDVHEATANDFVKRSLLEDETRAVGVGTALVGSALWNVKLVRKNALFPLKTGHLTIDPMSLTMAQVRVGLRATETLYVDVTEPDLASRPAGYAIGDVGEMALQATVAPRAVERDGAIGVTLELRGTGNLPGTLSLPEVLGVEWLEPQVRDKLGPLQNDRFGGTRTFSYVVRIHKEGAIDLGEIRLPYFDAAKNRYAVARAALGIVNVNVAPGPRRDAGQDEVEVTLAGFPALRTELASVSVRQRSYASESRLYWMGLFGSPLACSLGLLSIGVARRSRERRAATSPSPERTAKARHADADAACRRDDGPAAVAAIARALEAAVLAETAVNLRGAARDAIEAELASSGVGPDDTATVLAVAKACEDARFSPSEVSIDTARELWASARAVIVALSVAGRRSA